MGWVMGEVFLKGTDGCTHVVGFEVMLFSRCKQPVIVIGGRYFPEAPAQQWRALWPRLCCAGQREISSVPEAHYPLL